MNDCVDTSGNLGQKNWMVFCAVSDPSPVDHKWLTSQLLINTESRNRKPVCSRGSALSKSYHSTGPRLLLRPQDSMRCSWGPFSLKSPGQNQHVYKGRGCC